MDYIIREYMAGDEEFVATIHKEVYRDEYGWGDAFSCYAAKIAQNFSKEKGPDDHLWIADTVHGPVGSVMLCHTEDPDVGQLRLFIVDKQYRNTGIGSSLSAVLLTTAKEIGYKELMLWTAHPLTDAIRHYEKLGFVETERIPNNSWSLNGDTTYEIKMILLL